MPVFSYRALSPGGERQDGEIEASDHKSAIQLIQGRGLIPIEATPKSSFLKVDGSNGKQQAKRVGPSLRLFTRELATLLRAGEPIERALSLTASETDDRKLGESLQRILLAVRGGQPLADALSEERAHFPRYYIGMVKAGEQTGNLGNALNDIADLAERQEETRRKLIQALTYPAILGVVAVASVILMLVLVVPQFAPLLEERAAELPVLTQWVLALSAFVRGNGSILGLAALAIVAAFLVADRLPGLKEAKDAALLRAEWLGNWHKERVTGQLARALGTLLRGGLDLPSSLTMGAEMLDNSAARAAVLRARTAVRQGQRLADALAHEKILAPIGQRLIRTGDESGKLNELLPFLADQMERRIEARTASFLSIVEPLMVVILGLTVGTITVAILSAMLSLNELAI